MTADVRLAPGTYDVALDDIQIAKRHREQSDVTDLRESISRHGLMHPITVNTAGQLIAGAHRIQAHRELGLTHIRATVEERYDDPLLAELGEIDENLYHHTLTIQEQGEHLLRRSELLRQIGLRQGSGAPRNPDNLAGLAPQKTREIASQAGMSERTLQRRVSIIGAIPEDVRDITRRTGLANDQSQLEQLAKLGHEDQRAIASAVLEGTARTVDQAHRLLHPRPTDEYEGDFAVDDDTPERFYTVEMSIVAKFKVNNPATRMRGETELRRESIIPNDSAGHIITKELNVSYRERGEEGLRAALSEVAGVAFYDAKLRADWIDIPGRS